MVYDVRNDCIADPIDTNGIFFQRRGQLSDFNLVRPLLGSISTGFIVHEQESESYLELKWQITRHLSTICSEDSDFCDGKVGSPNREVMSHTGSKASNVRRGGEQMGLGASCRWRPP